MAFIESGVKHREIMRKCYYTVLYLCCFHLASPAQALNELMADYPGPSYKGYALLGVQGKDTLECSIAFDRKLEALAIPDKVRKIFVLIDTSLYRVLPESMEISGFGFSVKGKRHDYGLFFDSGQPPGMARAYFLKKIVVGVIDLYKYDQVEEIFDRWGPQVLANTQRTIPDPARLNRGRLAPKTYYVIGKSDSSRAEYSNPTKLPALRKQHVAPFLADYPDLLAIIPEKFSIGELKRYLQDYNYWRRQQMVSEKRIQQYP
jgi:hypothetical protein